MMRRMTADGRAGPTVGLPRVSRGTGRPEPSPMPPEADGPGMVPRALPRPAVDRALISGARGWPPASTGAAAGSGDGSGETGAGAASATQSARHAGAGAGRVATVDAHAVREATAQSPSEIDAMPIAYHPAHARRQGLPRDRDHTAPFCDLIEAWIGMRGSRPWRAGKRRTTTSVGRC
jgi:hypothetical protein